MKKLLKILAIALCVIVALIVVFLIYFNIRFPDVKAAPVITVQATPERIERGRYLANAVSVCIDCHATRDWTKFAGPIMPGTEGMGGQEFNEEVGGVPGRIFSSNITPAGIGDYTDGELLRAFTTGVTNDNRALFPLMPYLAYSNLAQEDAYSIIAYIRSLRPIENSVAEASLNFPLNLIVKTIPLSSFEPKPEPDRENRVEYGRYLSAIAACGDCHTPAEKGTPLPGMGYAGGFQFLLPGGLLRSQNITPEVETGIGKWMKEDFIARFKAFASPESQNVSVGPADFTTVMPWFMYAQMTDDDLGAIYEYLRTVKPVRNQVEKFNAKKQ